MENETSPLAKFSIIHSTSRLMISRLYNLSIQLERKKAFAILMSIAITKKRGREDPSVNTEVLDVVEQEAAKSVHDM